MTILLCKGLAGGEHSVTSDPYSLLHLPPFPSPPSFPSSSLLLLSHFLLPCPSSSCPPLTTFFSSRPTSPGHLSAVSDDVLDVLSTTRDLVVWVLLVQNRKSLPMLSCQGTCILDGGVALSACRWCSGLAFHLHCLLGSGKGCSWDLRVPGVSGGMLCSRSPLS